MTLCKVRALLVLVGIHWLIWRPATTSNGSLRLTLDRVADPHNNHELGYRSAMVSSPCSQNGTLMTCGRMPIDSVMVRFLTQIDL